MTRAILAGDWRAGAYGANRRAHLWTFAGSTNGRKRPACSARLRHETTGRRPTTAADACYECLAAAASGRAW